MGKPEAEGDEALAAGRASGEVTKHKPASGESPATVERRAAARFVVDADVLFSSEVQELHGTTCDLSVGGACVAAYRLLPVRTPITVKMSLPQGLLLCRAEIRWVKPSPARGGVGRMGVAFIGLSELDRKIIASCCADSVGPVSSRR